MMNRSILALLFASSAATLFAQNGEVSLSMGASRIRNNSLSSLSTADLLVTSNFHLALRMTINTKKFFGHEFGYAYNHGKLDSAGAEYSMPIHQGFYDFLVYAAPEGSKIRPFAAGGVHFSSFYPPGSSVFNGNGVTKFGVNYGGGLKVRVSDMFMVRADVRDYANGKPDFGLSPKGWLHQLEVSAGLAFVF